MPCYPDFHLRSDEERPFLEGSAEEAAVLQELIETELKKELKETFKCEKCSKESDKAGKCCDDKEMKKVTKKVDKKEEKKEENKEDKKDAKETPKDPKKEKD